MLIQLADLTREHSNLPVRTPQAHGSRPSTIAALRGVPTRFERASASLTAGPESAPMPAQTRTPLGVRWVLFKARSCAPHTHRRRTPRREGSGCRGRIL